MFRSIALLLLALFMVACLPVEAAPTELPPTETVTVTPLPSATIIWFPATATFTPFPTQEILPTLDYRPGLRGVLLEDNFEDPSTWGTSRTAVGSVAFGQQELTLAVASPRGSLFSLRNALRLTDYYLEIQAQPSLCRPGDVFGLLLRASSSIDNYRLLINCNGQVRMERLKNGEVVPLQDWLTSGQVFPGGMMRLRLGIWAFKEEIRIFINDEYQFTVRDPLWPDGQVGVFARSAGDTPLTVNFSRMQIYGLDQVVPSLLKSATPDPQATIAKTLLPTRAP